MSTTITVNQHITIDATPKSVFAFTYHAEATLDSPLRWLARPIERIFNRRAARDLRSVAEILTQPTRTNR